MSERTFTYEQMLAWRGIEVAIGDKPCDKCGGAGITAYGSTATWMGRMGGVGGQMITSDICDICWGSGNADKPWTNLRELQRKL